MTFSIGVWGKEKRRTFTSTVFSFSLEEEVHQSAYWLRNGGYGSWGQWRSFGRKSGIEHQACCGKMWGNRRGAFLCHWGSNLRERGKFARMKGSKHLVHIIFTVGMIEHFSNACRKVITWSRLLRLVIGSKDSRQFFNQWDAKPKPIAPCTRDFPALRASYRLFVGIVIGSSRWLLLLWLVGVVVLVLVFRQSFENRSMTLFMCSHWRVTVVFVNLS